MCMTLPTPDARRVAREEVQSKTKTLIAQLEALEWRVSALEARATQPRSKGTYPSPLVAVAKLPVTWCSRAAAILRSWSGKAPAA
jgi:hypothetical protein